MGVTPSRPTPVDQIDGLRPFTGSTLTYDQLDCVAACAAMLADRASGGRWQFTATQVRRASGITAYRGLYDSEAAQAILKLTSGEVVLTWMALQNRGEVRAMSDSGRGQAFTYSADVTYPTSRRTNSFRGVHKSVLNNIRNTRECACEARITTLHGEGLVEDPGTSRAEWLWWSTSLIYRSMEALGGYFTLVSPDTEGITRTIRKDTWASKYAFPRLGPGLQYAPRRRKPLPGGMAVHVIRTEEGGNWSYYGNKGNAWALVEIPDTGNERWIAACFLR